MESLTPEPRGRTPLFRHERAMVPRMKPRLSDLLDKHQAEILADWLKELGDSACEAKARAVLTALRTAVRNGNVDNVDAPEFAALRDLLASISRSRASSKPSEAATFIISLRRPLSAQIRKSAPDALTLERELGTATALIDKLALHAIDAFQTSRDEIVAREPVVLSPATADLVHDFNNLLAGIIGGINVLRGRIAKGQTNDIARFMDEIVNSAHRAASLTQELLASAQLQAPDPKETDIDN